MAQKNLFSNSAAKKPFGGGPPAKKKFFASQRGFTLFTALIAFILIVLSLLLVQSMISAERSVSEIISGASSQDEMQAIADLSRADALQVFNFGIRYTIEEFSKKDDNPHDNLPDNTYTVFPSETSNWENWKKNFVKDRFGVGEARKNQFALLAARHLISLLERTDDARGYRIDLVNPDEATMASILESTFDAQFSRGTGGTEFFEVINCEPGNDSSHYEKCNGSFYVTLDLSPGSMTDAQYEKFPQVRVENVQEHKILKEPILPRGRFRIYVPIRLFKALAGARQIAYSGESVAPGIFDPGFDDGIPQGKAGAEEFLDLKVKLLLKKKGILKEDGQPKSTEDFFLEKYDIVATSVQDAEGTAKLISYQATLYFRESNPKYIVSTKQPNVYGVTLKKFLQ